MKTQLELKEMLDEARELKKIPIIPNRRGDYYSHLQTYQDAINLFEEVLQNTPDDLDIILELSGAYILLAKATEHENRYNPSTKLYNVQNEQYKKAIEILEKTLESHPDAVNLQKALVDYYFCLGNSIDCWSVDFRIEDSIKVREYFQKSSDLGEKILAKYPNDKEAFDNTLRAQIVLKRHFTKNNDDQGLLNVYKKIIALLEIGIKQSQNSSEHDKLFAMTCFNKAILHNTEKRYDQAYDDYENAISSYIKVLHNNPNDSEAQSILEHAYISLKDIYIAMGLYDKALNTTQECIRSFKKLATMLPNNTYIQKRQLAGYQAIIDIINKSGAPNAIRAKIEIYKEIITISEDIISKQQNYSNFTESTIECYNKLHELCVQSNQLDAASRYLQRALVLQEGLCNLRYNQEYNKSRSLLINVLLNFTTQHNIHNDDAISLLASFTAFSIRNPQHMTILDAILKQSTTLCRIGLQYQISAEQLQFIQENKKNWQSVMILYSFNVSTQEPILHINRLSFPIKVLANQKEGEPLNTEQLEVRLMCESVCMLNFSTRLSTMDYLRVSAVATFPFVHSKYLPLKLIEYAKIMTCSALCQQLRCGDLIHLPQEVLSKILSLLPIYELPKLNIVCQGNQI